MALAGATKRENNNRFGDPAPSDVTTSGVAVVFNTVATAAGVNEFCVPKSTAATPATWGLAIDVPDIVAVAVTEDIAAEVIELPGAKISTHDP